MLRSPEESSPQPKMLLLVSILSEKTDWNYSCEARACAVVQLARFVHDQYSASERLALLRLVVGLTVS